MTRNNNNNSKCNQKLLRRFVKLKRCEDFSQVFLVLFYAKVSKAIYTSIPAFNIELVGAFFSLSVANKCKYLRCLLSCVCLAFTLPLQGLAIRSSMSVRAHLLWLQNGFGHSTKEEEEPDQEEAETLLPLCLPSGHCSLGAPDCAGCQMMHKFMSIFALNN